MLRSGLLAAVILAALIAAPSSAFEATTASAAAHNESPGRLYAGEAQAAIRAHLRRIFYTYEGSDPNQKWYGARAWGCRRASPLRMECFGESAEGLITQITEPGEQPFTAVSISYCQGHYSVREAKRTGKYSIHITSEDSIKCRTEDK